MAAAPTTPGITAIAHRSTGSTRIWPRAEAEGPQYASLVVTESELAGQDLAEHDHRHGEDDEGQDQKAFTLGVDRGPNLARHPAGGGETDRRAAWQRIELPAEVSARGARRESGDAHGGGDTDVALVQ